MLFPSAYYSIVSGSANSILLETSRPDLENENSYLFVNPIRVLTVETLDEIPGLFLQIEKYLREGHYVAGFMSYECGYHFEPAISKNLPKVSGLPLAWFGVYQRPFVFSHVSGQFEPELPAQCRGLTRPVGPATFPIYNGRLAMNYADYRERIEAIKNYIAAGDSYQINFTSKVLFDFPVPPAGLFAALRDRQKVSYAAFIHIENWNILSLSPELFFRIKDGRILTRPMKGTAPRGRDLTEDARLQARLQKDPKNCSENVMIVDLLRNDLGKIAETGSITVNELFAVEKYETLFQMTSTISGTLRPGTTFYEIFRALFPSGSVTGAPKFRTMQLIQELETDSRGVYTGAIGYFSPNHDAVFNVAIRTAVLDGNSGEMGVGGGIVFDSAAPQEYEECQLKAHFLTRPRPSFQLLESLLWDGDYHRLHQHLERLKSSVEYFSFACNEDEVLSALEQNQRQLRAGSAYKVRLLLHHDGTISVENIPLVPQSARGTVILSPSRVSSQDRFLYHKTTHRDLYERLHAEARQQGHEDVLFLNQRGELTESAHNNVFVEICNRLFTPPVDCGLLPGVFRRHILENEPRAAERTLTSNDLRAADAIHLCNSVRGLRQVDLLA